MSNLYPTQSSIPSHNVTSGLHVQFQPRMGHQLPTADILYILLPAGGAVLSNLYPTQSSIPSHNVTSSLKAFMYNSSHGWGIHYQQPIYCTFCYQPEEPRCQIYILPNLPFYLIKFTSILSECDVLALGNGTFVSNSWNIIHLLF